MRLTGPPGSLSHAIARRYRPTPAWALPGVVGAMVMIFAVDRLTGLAGVQHLYYVPIVFAAIRFGTRGGVSAAAAAIVLYHLADPRALTFQYGESDLLQIGVFVAAGLVSARLATDARLLHRLATTDDLTGLHNLRSFEVALRSMVHASLEGRTALSILVLDVDRLKSLNDVHGHLAGAEAVRTVGQTIGANIPPEAVACRYGGDEFVIAVPRCRTSEAVRIADDLRRAVHAQAPVLAGLRFPEATLTVSVGVASRSLDRGAVADPAASSEDRIGEALFRAADAALYKAKNGGRNRVYTD